VPYVFQNILKRTIIISKKKGYINELKPIIEKLVDNNFRISEKLLRRILEEVNEKM